MTNPHGDKNRVQLPTVKLGPVSFPETFHIISFDPGGTTGISQASYIQGDNYISFTGCQLGPEEHHPELYQFCTDYTDETSTIVYESFEFRQMGEDTKKKVELISREYIGIIKLAAAQYRLPIHSQTASTAKALIPDKGPMQDVKLKQLGLWTPGKPHAMDAYRHLLRHMVVSDRQLKNFLAERWFNG